MPRRLREEIIESIIELLKESPKTAKELQESLQVPRRTLFRYLRILRNDGVVISLGKGRGYCLSDPEALIEFYRRFLKVGDIFPAIPACWRFVEGVITCPSKRGRAKLAIKAQNILFYTSQIIFIQSILAVSTLKDPYYTEEVLHYLAEAIFELARMNLELLRESRCHKLREALKALENDIIEKAFKEADDYAETVKRIAGHLK